MKQNKLLYLLLPLVSAGAMSSCEFGSDKREIANTMREYVEPNLDEDETFGFIGLSNHRDTVFMGVTRPCVGVIYTVTDNDTGEKTRHFADVVFSDDYKTALSVKELDFDPVKIVEEKVREKLSEKILEGLGE